MSSIGGAIQDMKPDVGRTRRHPIRTLDSALPTSADRPHRRDRFRAAVAALDPGPLRDVLTAVAYARDEAARTGTAAPTGRWLAVVVAAEQAAHAAATDAAGPRWAAA